MEKTDYPIVRLKPKANAKAIRHGFPWAYDNEIVTDRRTRNLTSSDIAVLEDADRQKLALVAVNPNSRIFARILDRDPAASITVGWLVSHLQRALEMRETLYDTPFYRLIHAEADGLPGVVVDRFGETVVFQPNAAWADARSDMIAEALDRVLGPTAIVMNGAGRARKAEGLSEEVVLLKGNVDAAIPVQMNGATYFADVIGGQKTGLFFDQRPNHAFAARLARQGARVLDVFSHVGGFSLACLAQGARTALAVDGSSPALELAQKGAQAMNRGDDLQTRQGDAFQVMEALAAERAEFDIVICDPPAFAPNKKALDAGLRAYERVARLAAPLVRKGGYLGLCSCSHAADLSRFRGASARGIGRAGRSAQLIHTGFAGPDHPQLPQLAETGYLKSVFFRLN
jgi:23S rRNA (cytosine1962-C5)-methyltransferase